MLAYICRMLSRWLIVGLLIASSLDASLARAEPVVVERPIDAVRRHLDEIIALARDPRPDATARRAAADRAVHGTFDFVEISRRALGPHWQRMRPEERTQFSESFASMLTAAYVSRIAHYLGDRVELLRDRVHFVSESTAGRQSIVRTTITYAGQDVPVEFALGRYGQTWRIYDATVHGVRLTENIRAQISRLTRGSDYHEVLTRLRERLEESPSAVEYSESASPRLR